MSDSIEEAEARVWTNERIREAFIFDGGQAEYYDPINGAQEQRRIAGAIFDDWLSSHDAEMIARAVKAEPERDAWERRCADTEIAHGESEARTDALQARIDEALERLEHVVHPDTTRCYICDAERILKGESW